MIGAPACKVLDLVKGPFQRECRPEYKQHHETRHGVKAVLVLEAELFYMASQKKYNNFDITLLER
jgi:hypothetical protein